MDTRQITIKRELIAKINALPDTSDQTVYAPLVIEMFCQVPYIVFRTIDDEIGNASRQYTRGYLVRRVRNDPVYGPQLFAVLAR